MRTNQSETDAAYQALFDSIRERLKTHNCHDGDQRPAVRIVGSETAEFSHRYVLLDNGKFEFDDEEDPTSKDLKFEVVACEDCDESLVKKTFKYRDVQDGTVREIQAYSLDEANKVLESEYSDPIHAWQDYASMDV